MRHLEFLLLLVLLIFILPFSSFSDEIIRGYYSYTYGDNESLVEAREICRTLAIRNALESYQVFIEATTTIKNFRLTNDLIQMITSGYIKEVKVLNHTENGRIISEKISCRIEPIAIKNILRREVTKSVKGIEEKGIDNNGYLKILSAKKKKEQNKWIIDIVVKILKPVGHYANEDDRFQTIFITYFDSEGNPINGDSINIKTKYVNLFPSEVRKISFIIDIDAKSFKVWLQNEPCNLDNK